MKKYVDEASIEFVLEAVTIAKNLNHELENRFCLRETNRDNNVIAIAELLIKAQQVRDEKTKTE